MQPSYEHADPRVAALYGSSQTRFWSDSLRGKSYFYIVFQLVMVAASWVFLYTTKSDPYSALIPFQIIYYLMVAGMVVHRIFRGGWTNIMAPDITFVAFYTLVHLGYLTSHTLNIVPYSEKVFHFEEAIPRSMLVINIGLAAFLIGYELAGPSALKRANAQPVGFVPQNWSTLGLVVTTVGILTHVAGIFSAGIGDFIEYGNTIIQADLVKVRSLHTILLLTLGSRLFLMGLTVHMLSSALRSGKLFESKAVQFLFFLMIALFILEGDRAPIFMTVVPAMFIRHYLIKPWKPYTICAIVLAFGMLFVAIFAIREVGANPAQLASELSAQREKGNIKSANMFLELGFVYNTLNYTTGVVPEYEPYWYGAGWRDALIHVVPFAQGAAIRAGFGRESPSQWLLISMYGPSLASDAAGLGFTISGDGYLNLGYPGVFIELFAIGFFFRWVVVRFCLQPTMVRGLVLFGIFGIVVFITRNDSNTLLAPCVQVFVISWILGKFFSLQRTPA